MCRTSRAVPDDSTSSDSNRFASVMTDRVASSATAANAVYHRAAVRSSDARRQITDRASGACTSMVQLRKSGVATLRQTKHRRRGIIRQSPKAGAVDPLSVEASIDGPVQPISARNEDLRKYGVTSRKYFTENAHTPGHDKNVHTVNLIFTGNTDSDGKQALNAVHNT